MDVYTAKIQIGKLLEYVENIADSRPKMYKKSINRWKEIAETCQQVVRVISEIVQEEILEDDIEDHVTSNTAHEIQSMIMYMKNEIDQIKDFVSYPSNTTPDIPKNIVSAPNSNSKNKIPKEDRREAIAKYKDVLSKLPNKVKDYPSAYECAMLIWRWFDSRFMQSTQIHTQFRYNIRRIPNWIIDIVIVYSNHLIEGDSDEFIHSFNDWCDSLLDPSSDCNFAVPYEVFKVDTDSDKSDVSLTSVVLWDILVDLGLSELCIEDSFNLYLSESALYDICANYNESILDDYKNYKVDNNILSKCNIVRCI